MEKIDPSRTYKLNIKTNTKENSKLKTSSTPKNLKREIKASLSLKQNTVGNKIDKIRSNNVGDVKHDLRKNKINEISKPFLLSDYMKFDIRKPLIP